MGEHAWFEITETVEELTGTQEEEVNL